MAIVLILLGLSHRLWAKNRLVYPLVVAGTGAVSVVYALDQAGVSLGVLGNLARRLPLYGMGFCWVSVAAVLLAAAAAAAPLLRRRARAGGEG